jgi:hypothetical protein
MNMRRPFFFIDFSSFFSLLDCKKLLLGKSWYIKKGSLVKGYYSLAHPQFL